MNGNELSIMPTAEVRPASTLSERAARVRQMRERHARMSLEQMFDIGRELWEARDQCVRERQPWGRWLTDARIPQTTASNYLRVWIERDAVGAESATVADLGLRGVVNWLAERSNSPAKQVQSGPQVVAQQKPADDLDVTESVATEDLGEDEPAVPTPSIPVPRPGCSYLWMGTDPQGGEACMEIAVLPNNPKCWVTAIIFFGSGVTEYCARGTCLDDPKILPWLMRRAGFVPGPHGWVEWLREPGELPMAAEDDLVARRRCEGQWNWFAESPAAAREALVREAMDLWGVTEEPSGQGGTFLKDRSQPAWVKPTALCLSAAT